MKIDEIEVGKLYRQRYGTAPVKVLEIFVKQLTRGYSWNRRTVNRRRLRVEVNGHEETLRASDLEEPWEAFAERQQAIEQEVYEHSRREGLVRAHLVHLGLPVEAISDVWTDQYGHIDVQLSELYVAAIVGTMPSTSA